MGQNVPKFLFHPSPQRTYMIKNKCRNTIPVVLRHYLYRIGVIEIIGVIRVIGVIGVIRVIEVFRVFGVIRVIYSLKNNLLAGGTNYSYLMMKMSSSGRFI